MGKDVIISVKGSQVNMLNDVNETELVTQGTFYKKGDSYYVTYKETEITGMEGTTTTLKLSDKKVTLMRSGTVNSQMIFEQGQKHVSYYETVYGAFTIGVFAHQVDVRVNDSGGEVTVGYQIEVDNTATGSNDFYMKIREAGLNNDEHHRKNEGTGKTGCMECN